MSESDKVKDVYNVLVNKYNFSRDLLKLEPAGEDIENKTVRDILSRASKKLTGEQGFPDIYYCNEKDKFLILVEFKPKISQHKRAIKEINIYLSFFKKLSAKYKIIGLAISGDIEKKTKFKIDTFAFKEKEIENINISDHLLNEEEYRAWFDKTQQPLEYGKIRKIARELNEIFRQESWGLGDKQKLFLLVLAYWLSIIKISIKTFV